ncbi:MAG TPA: enoyl-CoA hydratase-related protein, partial [Bryobacteraceae bacterium]|nr:enoyl-CoA hydratase-related protein [Bryobacteraceae bacterium]
MTTSFQIEEHQGVKVLRMISQDGTNRLTSEFVLSLTEAVSKLRNEARGLVIAGNDRFFSAGADLEQIAALDGPTAHEFAKMGQSLMQVVE